MTATESNLILENPCDFYKLPGSVRAKMIDTWFINNNVIYFPVRLSYEDGLIFITTKQWSTNWFQIGKLDCSGIFTTHHCNDEFAIYQQALEYINNIPKYRYSYWNIFNAIKDAFGKVNFEI